MLQESAWQFVIFRTIFATAPVPFEEFVTVDLCMLTFDTSPVDQATAHPAKA
jgi:hypothetical protein